MNYKRAGAAATGLAMACTGLFVATPALASHGGSDAIRTSGQCAHGAGVWKLKGKADDGRIEVEFEVDTNQVGQTWHVRITDNGDVVVNRDFTTVAPSGSFSVQRRPANKAGVTDTIRAHAFRGDTVCGGQVRV
jgi:hypothetical protein